MSIIYHRLRCLDGRLMKHDPQLDDPYLETDLGVCPDCEGFGCEPPKALGVSRMADNDRAILVSFSKMLTDDEMRDFHDYVREWER
jgi:hypothetical protein